MGIDESVFEGEELRQLKQQRQEPHPGQQLQRRPLLRHRLRATPGLLPRRRLQPHQQYQQPLPELPATSARQVGASQAGRAPDGEPEIREGMPRIREVTVRRQDQTDHPQDVDSGLPLGEGKR